MEDAAQALAYHEADFSVAHGLRVALFRSFFPDTILTGKVLDLGCGSGDVLLRFARAWPRAQFVGVDGSRPMLALAQPDIEGDAALRPRIRLVQAVLPTDPLPREPWQLIMSHSLLHQLHRPEVLWQTIREYGAAGCLVFVADLQRPASAAAANRIVQETSAGEPEILRRDFCNSLCAAFDPDEVRSQLHAAGLTRLEVRSAPPFHLIVAGRL
jgi:SAM-dependent methyltransferase